MCYKVFIQNVIYREKDKAHICKAYITKLQIILTKHSTLVISFSYAASDGYRVYRRFGDRHEVARMATRMQPTPTRNVPPQCKLAQAACLWKRRTILSRYVSLICRGPLCKCAFST